MKLLAASMFVANGFAFCRLAYGHTTLLPALLVPGILWGFHRLGDWTHAGAGLQRGARWALGLFVLGAVFALAMDGAPQVIAYVMFWIGLYALTLSFVRRSAGPVLVFVGAVAVAAVLDAAWLWPMVEAQQHHPRIRELRFTNPGGLLFFLVVPMRTTSPFRPSLGNGHELTVFVGIVVAYALWRYRRKLRRVVPRDLAVPLLVTSLVSIWVGMGSLEALGVPRVLSPYDWLRQLPGFRSLGVTGRFWGFLALPLSLLGSVALRWLFLQRAGRRHFAIWVVLAFIPLVFLVTTVGEKLGGSRVYEPFSLEGLYDGGGERVEYVYRDLGFQGLLITPTTGVIDAYNSHDFFRPPIEPGSQLVRSVHIDGREVERAGFDGVFMTWRHIRLRPPEAAALPAGDAVRIVLNQAWHKYWRADAGAVARGDENHLEVVLDRDALLRGPVDVRYHDPVSVLGVEVSGIAWLALLPLLLVLLVLAIALGRGKKRPPAPERTPGVAEEGRGQNA
jgi:hypothetical protein